MFFFLLFLFFPRGRLHRGSVASGLLCAIIVFFLVETERMKTLKLKQVVLVGLPCEGFCPFLC